jgi:hypothetical protein
MQNTKKRLIKKTLSDRLANLLIKDDKKNWLVISASALLILSPLILTAILTYAKTRHDLTTLTLLQRQTIAYLAATTLKGKLDRPIDISFSLVFGAVGLALLTIGQSRHCASRQRSSLGRFSASAWRSRRRPMTGCTPARNALACWWEACRIKRFRCSIHSVALRRAHS